MIALAPLIVPMVAAGQQEPAAGDSDGATAGGVVTQTLPVLADRPPLLLVQVVEAETGRPIPGLQVFLAGTEIGGVTDEAGRFDVYAPESGTWRIGFRQIGRVDESVELELERSTVTQVLAALRADRLPRHDVQLLPPLPGPPRGASADTTAARRAMVGRRIAVLGLLVPALGRGDAWRDVVSRSADIGRSMDG